MTERAQNPHGLTHLGQSLEVDRTSESNFFWNLYARCYDSIYHLMPYRKLLWDTLQALDLKPGMRILDAGCGTGNFELFTSEKNIPPVEVEAIDFSPVMLSRAVSKCKHLDYVDFKLADMDQKLNYPDNTFDRILCIHVLYALKQPESAVQEFQRVLKPAGKIVITNPKPNAHVTPLIQEHFARIKNVWGWSRKSLILLKSFILLPTAGLAPIVLNLFVIEKRGRKKNYHFLRKEELLALLEQEELQGIDIDSSYANQNWFARMNKAFPRAEETVI